MATEKHRKTNVIISDRLHKIGTKKAEKYGCNGLSHMTRVALDFYMNRYITKEDDVLIKKLIESNNLSRRPKKLNEKAI